MKTNIQIPATWERKLAVRCFTCWPHQLLREFVDTDNYYEDIVLPEGVAPSDHKRIVKAICEWRMAGNRDKVVLAYTTVEVTEIVDDRRTWSHESQSSYKDERNCSDKVAVLAGAEIIPFAQLTRDAAWIKQRRDRHANDRDEATATARRITFYTLPAFVWIKETYKLRPASKLLKFGPGVYIPLSEGVVYMPERSINPKSLFA